METASISNEGAPLLREIRIDISPNEQTSLDRNQTAVKGRLPLKGDRTTPNEPTPHTEQGEANEVSLEEIIQAMCTAWRQHKRPKDCAIDYGLSADGYFSPKQGYAMRLAWRNLTSGRQCAHKPQVIAEAVATAMTKELLPAPQGDESDADFQMRFAIKKNIIAADYLGHWYGFDDEDINEVLYIFPIRYIETMFVDSFDKFWYKVVELYDKVHDFFLKPKLQLILHTLLFFWPIAFLIIGSMYMDCPMGHYLSPLMMVLGCVGGFATLFRLALMYLSEGQSFTDYFYKWKFLRLTELTFMTIFFVQAFHFFYIDPKTEPDPYGCVQDFYNAALVINYTSIPLASVYVFAYSIIICSNIFQFWIWIVRRF